MKPNIVMKLAAYMAWILLCKSCKFCDKICYTCETIFPKGLFLLVHPVDSVGLFLHAKFDHDQSTWMAARALKDQNFIRIAKFYSYLVYRDEGMHWSSWNLACKHRPQDHSQTHWSAMDRWIQKTQKIWKFVENWILSCRGKKRVYQLMEHVMMPHAQSNIMMYEEKGFKYQK